MCAAHFKAQPHRLYQNNRDGTFRDVSLEAACARTRRRRQRLGVLLADLNDDQRPDIYAVNDTQDNLLIPESRRARPATLRGKGPGRRRGPRRPRPTQRQHGRRCGRLRRLRPTVAVGQHYEMEVHNLYHNQGGELFLYRSQYAGIAALGRMFVGFGTGFLDVGRRRLGRPVHHQRPRTAPAVAQHAPPAPGAVAQRGRGQVRRRERGARAYFTTGHLGRGVAIGDLDNDGHADLVISHLNEPVVVLRAQPSGGGENHWLGVELAGKDHADVVGAKLVLEVGGRRLTRFVKGGGSYLSSGDRRILFGLGTATEAGRLTVSWPSGADQHWDGLALDRYHRLVEGGAAQRK